MKFRAKMCAYAARMNEKQTVERANDGLLTKRTLAPKLQISTRTLDSWMKKGLVPFIKVGGKTVRFRLGDVLEKLNARRVN
jgi:predicted DNA-binding transcriptional regulator AlpA